MQREQAESIAIQALGWLAADEDLLGMFLSSTGASVAEIKNMAQNPEFLGSVLEFILMDDSHVIGFCDSIGLDYEIPMMARQYLPGGQIVNWT